MWVISERLKTNSLICIRQLQGTHWAFISEKKIIQSSCSLTQYMIKEGKDEQRKPSGTLVTLTYLSWGCLTTFGFFVPTFPSLLIPLSSSSPPEGVAVQSYSEKLMKKHISITEWKHTCEVNSCPTEYTFLSSPELIFNWGPLWLTLPLKSLLIITAPS